MVFEAKDFEEIHPVEPAERQHHLLKKVFAPAGEEWPRVSVAIYPGTSHPDQIVVAIDIKHDELAWWGSSSLPRELIPELIEMLKAFKMITRPETLITAAKEAGIEVPPDLHNYNKSDYLFWHLYCSVQIDRPMPATNSDRRNARVIADIDPEQIKDISFGDVVDFLE